MNVFNFLKRQKEAIVLKDNNKIILSNNQQLEKAMANLRLAIENEEYVFPEFSSLEIEEAKSLSLKSLSIAARIFQLGAQSGSED